MPILDGGELCLDALQEAESHWAVPMTVDVLVPNEYGGHYLRHKRFRTFGEIYADMHRQMQKLKCFGCGKEYEGSYNPCNWYKNLEPNLRTCCDKPDWGELIDEYDRAGVYRKEELLQEVGKPGERIVDIMCYCSVGGNEGYMADCDLLLEKDHIREQRRVVNVYHVKSFRGMEHVHDLVKRMMKAVGSWPTWCDK